jgi:hypothetical protein
MPGTKKRTLKKSCVAAKITCYLTDLGDFLKVLWMMNFDAPSASLPQALGGALLRLAQLAHTSSWDQWAVQRLTPTVAATAEQGPLERLASTPPDQQDPLNT